MKYQTIYESYLENKNLELLVQSILSLNAQEQQEILQYLESKLKKVEIMKIKTKLQSVKHSKSLNLEYKEQEKVINTHVQQKLLIEQIEPNPNQPRKQYKEDEMKLLADSIYKSGLINPIFIYQENEKYILVAGQLRLAAYKYLNNKYPNSGFNEIDVRFLNTLNPSESFLLLLAIEENTHRNELDIFQTAESYEKLLIIKEREEGRKIPIRDFAETVNISKTMLHELLKIADLKHTDEDIYNFIKKCNITSRTAIIRILNKDIGKEDKLKLIENYSLNKITIKDLENNSIQTLPDSMENESNLEITKTKKQKIGVGELANYLEVSENELLNEDAKKIELMLLGLEKKLKIRYLGG